MTFNILSLYRKTWPGKKFSVSFLHDSVHCEHCLKGRVHIPKEEPKVRNYGPPPLEDLSKSVFHQTHSKDFLEIKHNSIPENSFLPLGIKLTKSIAEKLRPSPKKVTKKPLQSQCDQRNIQKFVKSLSKKTAHCEKRKVTKCSRTENKEPVRKILRSDSRPTVKVHSVQENKVVKNKKIPVREPASPSEPIEFLKEPTKGTLKRKRWRLQKMKEINSTYEDDLFEDVQFCSFQAIINDDSDSNKYQEIKTPQISLSPVRDGSSTPSCHDCYSPGELFTNRKEAEKYIFRRKKRRKMKLQDEIEKSEPSSGRPEHSDDYTKNLIEKACKFLEKAALKAEKDEESEEEDDYLTDTSDDSF